MMRSNTSGIKQWASTALDAASGSQSVTISLPAGQTGKPVTLKVAGAVSALVTLTFGNGSAISAICNPNAAADQVSIPQSGFPSPTNSVTLTVNASAAGYVYISVGFA